MADVAEMVVVVNEEVRLMVHSNLASTLAELSPHRAGTEGNWPETSAFEALMGQCGN